MKRFKDLTELEIKGLTIQEVERYILIECAENGITIIDKPQKPEYAKDIEKDIKVYNVVRGYSSIYVDFVKEDEAKKVSDLLNECDIVDKQMYSVLPKLDYSENAKIRQKQVESANRAIKEKYENALAKYNEYEEASSVLSKPIYEKWSEIKEKYDRLDLILRKYTEMYLPLSDNNEEIAKRFLRSAFILNEDDEKYLFG